VPEFASVYSVISISWGLKLGLTLIIAAAAGWDWSRHFSPNASPHPVWATLVGLHAIPLALFVPVLFSWKSVALVAATTGLTGKMSRPTLPAQAPTGDEKAAAKLATILSIVLFALWICLTLRPQPFTHYDYFLNSNLLSLDLARSGSYASAWAVKHDIHNWFLIQMTSTVALDAFEMQWLSSNTNLFPRLLELLALCGALTLLARRSRNGAILFAAVCLFYIFEQSVQFRPHLFVGIFVAIAALLLAEKAPRMAPVIVIAILLALAKRDGLVLAPIVALLSYRSFSLKIHGSIALVGLLAAASFLRIGGRSPLVYLYQTIYRPQNLTAFIEFIKSPLFIICLAALGYLAWRQRDNLALRKPLLLIAAALTMTLVGSLILVDAGYLTPGTNMRKVLYILAPSVLALFCAAGWPQLRRPVLAYKAALGSGAILAILTLAMLQPLVDARRVLPNWTNAALGGSHYLRSLVQDMSSAPRIGIYSPNENSFALSPFGDIYTFKWPFLIAYVGQELEFSNDIAKLGEMDIIFLPPELNDQERIALAAQTGYDYYKLHGIYGVLAKPTASKILALENTKAMPGGKPNTIPRDALPIDRLSAKWGDDVQVADVKRLEYSGERILQDISWNSIPNAGTATISLEIQNPQRRMIRYIDFSEPPTGQSGIANIAVETLEGTYELAPGTIARNGTYSLPINTRDPLKLRITALNERSHKELTIHIFDMRADVENPDTDR